MTEIVSARGDRSDGVSYQELLNTDSRPVPAVLRRENPLAGGVQKVDIERYISRAAHEREKERLWSRVWQMACREEDIPEVGSYTVYDIAQQSYLVVRSAPDTIQAFYNACRHRGRLLREEPGRSHDLRCPFHGWCWHLDGSLKEVPCQWDFPQVTPEEYRLPEVRVGRWGGFVFINPDPDCEPLERFLGDLSQQFAPWPLEQRFKQAHVAKILRCNWKLAQEAFMEAYHVVATHPQILAGIGDANSQYDVWGNYSRAITPNGTPSPHLNWTPTEQDMLDAMLDRNLDDPPVASIPDGMSAREFVGTTGRQAMQPIFGDGVERFSDAEMTDSFYFTLFPNFHPWGAFNRITYRFRPYGDDHRMSIMECMYLAPYPPGERPPAVPIHWLGADDDWTEAPELGMLARVFNQDVYNLPKVQRGLEAAKKPGCVTFASYAETKLRHFHRLYDRWVDAE